MTHGTENHLDDPNHQPAHPWNSVTTKEVEEDKNKFLKSVLALTMTSPYICLYILAATIF